jgi:DUF1365 family protein
MSLHSAIYVGRVRHRRREPARTFSFPLFMVYLDLAEVDRVLSMSRLWGRSRWCPARFRRDDYLEPHDLALDEAVRRRVEASLGRRPSGPIRMLTHLRYFGYVFNPVTFYYCFEESDRVSAIVAEITNTPWRERHAYVLDSKRLPFAPDVRPMRWRFGKEFHVSPFLPLDLEYDWTFTTPGDSLLVHMNVRDRRPTSARVFDATLSLERRDMTPARLRAVLARYPLMTAQVILKIHAEALGLWLRRAPVFPHPGSAAQPTPAAGDSR